MSGGVSAALLPMSASMRESIARRESRRFAAEPQPVTGWAVLDEEKTDALACALNALKAAHTVMSTDQKAEDRNDPDDARAPRKSRVVIAGQWHARFHAIDEVESAIAMLEEA